MNLIMNGNTKEILKQIIREIIEEQTVVSYEKLEDCPRLLMKAFDEDLYDSGQAINSHKEIHQQILKNRHNPEGMLEVLKKFGEKATRKFMKEVITTKHI